MRPQIYSYNGVLLNDTNFDTGWPVGALYMSPALVIDVERAGMEPYYAGKRHGGRVIPLIIEMRGTVGTQLDQLLTLFDPDDDTQHDLVVKDLDSVGGDLWTIKATTQGQGISCVGNTVKVNLWTEGSTWKGAHNTQAWNVTASGSHQTATAGGKIPALPTITISPQNARAGGYAYKRWVPIYNNTPNAAPYYPLELTGGGLNTAGLVANTSKSNQINQGGGIDAVVTTIPIDTAVGGGLPASGMAYLGTEQIYYAANSGSSLTGVVRGVHGTTAASHADNTVITWSQMQADGGDWRAMVDGNVADRWLADMNGATSKMWITLGLSPYLETTLSGSIAGSGAVSTILVKKTAANKTALTAMGKAANMVLLIGSEAFTFTGVNTGVSPYQITGVARAQQGTSMGAHADGDKIRWIEHDVWMVYGNSDTITASDSETAGIYKPIFNLSTSTNTSWDYDYFMDAVARSGAWSAARLKSLGGLSEYYTATQDGMAFPAAMAGAAIKAYMAANVWKAETAQVQWLWSHPFGATTLSWDGEKYRYAAQWPSLAALQKSSDGKDWSTVANEATPSTAQSWQALATHSGVSLSGTYKNLRIYFGGSIGASANNMACLGVDNMTITLDSAKTPTVSLGAEQANYHYDLTLTNETTGEVMQVSGPGALSDVLSIDCDAKTATFANGTPAQAMVSGDWLTLAAGANTLRYDEVGVTHVDVVVSWYDRRKL